MSGSYRACLDLSMDLNLKVIFEESMSVSSRYCFLNVGMLLVHVVSGDVVRDRNDQPEVAQLEPLHSI